MKPPGVYYIKRPVMLQSLKLLEGQVRICLPGV